MTLATHRLEGHPRIIIPLCLLKSAPAKFEILDHGKRVEPTLAGYVLNRGQQYELRIWPQEQGVGVEVKISAPKSVLESHEQPDTRDGAEVIVFTTAGGNPLDLQGLLLIHGSLKVILTYPDEREPYDFEIPVILCVKRWRYATFTLIATGASALLNRASEGSWEAVFDTNGLLLLGLIILMIVLAAFGWEIWTRRSLAQTFLQKTRARFAPLPKSGEHTDQ